MQQRPATNCRHSKLCNTNAQERLELYGTKVKKAAYDTELASSRRTLAVDVAAANRFIDAAMASDLSKDQRLALQQVNAVDWQGADRVTSFAAAFRNCSQTGIAQAVTRCCCAGTQGS